MRTDADADTGMWKVTPDFNIDGTRTTSVVHVKSILWNADLIPCHGDLLVPREITPFNSLDTYQAYFVSKFADHHAHEIAFYL